MTNYSRFWKDIEKLNLLLPAPPKNLDAFLSEVPNHLEAMRENASYLSLIDRFTCEDHMIAQNVILWIEECGSKFTEHPEVVLNLMYNGFDTEDEIFIKWGLESAFEALFRILPRDVVELLNDGQ